MPLPLSLRLSSAPSSPSLAAIGRFASPRSLNLLSLATNNNAQTSIDIWAIDSSNHSSYRLPNPSIDLQVVGLGTLSLPGEKDFIVAAEYPSQLHILTLNPEINAFETLDHERFEIVNSEWIEWGRFIKKLSPECILVGSVENSKLVYILIEPDGSGARLNVTNEIEFIDTESTVSTVQVVDVVALDVENGCLFACLEVEREAPADTIRKQRVSFYEISIESNELTQVASNIVSSSVYKILSMPMPHDAQSPPGVLLCEPGFITFLPINELEEESDHFLPRIPIPIPISSSNHPNEETFEVLISHAISLPSTSTTYPTLLLQSYSNDFYRLYATSFHSSSSYPTLHIHYLDSLPPSTFDRVFGMPVSHDHYEIVCLDRRNNIISCVSLDFDDLTKPLSEHSVYATLDFRQSTALPDVYTTKHVCKYLRQRSDLTNSNRNESGTQSNNHASQNIMQSEPVNQSQNAVAQPQEYIQFTQSHQRQSSASSNMMRIPQPRQSQYFPPSQQPYIPQQNQIPTSFRPPQFQIPEQLYRPPHRHSMHQAQMSSFHRPPQRAPFGRTPIIVPNYPVPYSSVTSQQNHYAGANRPPSVLGSVPSYPQINPANNMVFVRPLVQRSTSLRRPNMNRPAPNGQFPQQLQHQVNDPFRAPPNPMFYRRSYIDPNHSNLLQSVPSFVPPLTPRPLHNHPNLYMNRGPARPSQTVAALTMANTVYRPQSPQQVTRPGYLPPNRAPQRQSSLRRPNIQSQSIITQPHTPLQALAPSQVQNLSQKQKSPVLAISQSQISQRNSSLRRLLVSTSVSPTNLSPESNTPSPISSAQNTESSVPEEKEPEETEEERQEREKLEAEMKRKKRLEMRKFIAREIFETEKNYARNLGILESYFINPLTKAVKTSNQIVSPVFIRIVFNFCNELKEFSEFFSKILEDVVESWDLETSVVGKTFLDNNTSFEIFLKYVDNYSSALNIIRRTEEGNNNFKSFNDSAASSKETNRQRLTDFLILPIQRVTRYSLLLRDLKKHTPEDHPDYTHLDSALEQMSNIAAKVNLVKQQEEEMTRMFQVFKLVEGCPPTIIKYSRRVIFECEVQETRHSKTMRLFLFSDTLMIARVSVKSKLGLIHHNKVLKFLRLLDLGDLDLVEMADVDDSVGSSQTIRITIDPLSVSAASSTLNTKSSSSPASASTNASTSPQNSLSQVSPSPSTTPTGSSATGKEADLPLKYVFYFSDGKSKQDFVFALKSKIKSAKESRGRKEKEKLKDKGSKSAAGGKGEDSGTGRRSMDTTRSKDSGKGSSVVTESGVDSSTETKPKTTTSSIAESGVEILIEESSKTESTLMRSQRSWSTSSLAELGESFVGKPKKTKVLRSFFGTQVPSNNGATKKLENGNGSTTAEKGEPQQKDQQESETREGTNTSSTGTSASSSPDPVALRRSGSGENKRKSRFPAFFGPSSASSEHSSDKQDSCDESSSDVESQQGKSEDKSKEPPGSSSPVIVNTQRKSKRLTNFFSLSTSSSNSASNNSLSNSMSSPNNTSDTNSTTLSDTMQVVSPSSIDNTSDSNVSSSPHSHHHTHSYSSPPTPTKKSTTAASRLHNIFASSVSKSASLPVLRKSTSLSSSISSKSSRSSSPHRSHHNDPHKSTFKNTHKKSVSETGSIDSLSSSSSNTSNSSTSNVASVFHTPSSNSISISASSGSNVTSNTNSTVTTISRNGSMRGYNRGSGKVNSHPDIAMLKNELNKLSVDEVDEGEENSREGMNIDGENRSVGGSESDGSKIEGTESEGEHDKTQSGNDKVERVSPLRSKFTVGMEEGIKEEDEGSNSQISQNDTN